MNITLDQFKEIVPSGECHKAKLHAIPRVHEIAVRQYCNKLTARSACSTDCRTCGLQILLAIREVQQALNKPDTNPYALYTWVLKDAVARTMDAQLEAKNASNKVIKKLGETIKVDGLDLFLEELNG